MDNRPRLLVVGMPRGGTLYSSTVLRELLGLRIGHESNRGRDGMCGMAYAVCHPVAGHLCNVRGRPSVKNFECVVHVVRHPLRTIASLEVNFYRDTAITETVAACDLWFRKSQRYFKNPTERWAAAWASWVVVCERVRHLADQAGCRTVRGQVESPTWVADVAQAFGLTPPAAEDVRAVMARQINHKKKVPRLTWKELHRKCSREVEERVLLQAEYLGYDVDQEQWAEMGAETLARWCLDNPY
jgi:hypothetical protein